MTVLRLMSLTSLAMLAFAGNSLLCRVALKQALIDAASFTTVRLVSGALVLVLLASLRARARASVDGVQPGDRLGGNWRSGVILFVYASAFSFAYTSLPTGAGALLLFGAVQLTMHIAAWRLGERLNLQQTAGLGMALAGLAVMLMPGLSAPPLPGALLMIVAGIAWGAYSLLGRGVASPVAATAGNFLRAAPLSIALSLALAARIELVASGVLYAVLSGALTSGVGYVLWYEAVRGLSATRAASVQLTVPVLAAFGGTLFLGERITWRLLIACAAVLGGIALVVFGARRAPLALQATE
jgi:drug/metabolite transporter (DMT)-like permease